MGNEEAVVRVTPLVPVAGEDGSAPEVAEDILKRLIDLMGLSGSVEYQDQPIVDTGEEDTSVVFNIRGEDLGILIGRRGQTLACLQYILRLIIGRQTDNWVPIVIDVEGYKQRRYQALQVLARNMAEQVKVRGESFTMEPMPAYERRIIHLALVDHPDVTTESIGQGEFRKVVITPEG